MNADRRRAVWVAARTTAGWVGVYAVMVLVASVLRVPGSDWVHHFQPRVDLYDYPPLIYVLLAMLPSLPFLNGLTLTALLFALRRRQARPVHVLAAFTAMPLYWTLWLGQVDAVPMLGLALLPWGLPLVMLKPQAAIWYAWAWWRRQPRKWLIAGGMTLFVLVTFAVWGLWPARFRTPPTITSVYNLSLWASLWPVALIALAGALIDPDPDRAMALGSMGVPYVQGCSYIVLLPVLARLRGWRLGLAWLASWVSLPALVWGDRLRPLAALFPLILWALLAWDEYAVRRRQAAAVTA